MDSFVDDTTAWVNDFEPSLKDRQITPIQPIADDLQATAQQWEELLYGTGGALERSKCFYYLIHWTFDQHANPALSTSMMPPISILSSANGNSVPIKQLQHDKPHQTLGVLLSPDKSHKAELERLTNKAQEFARQTNSTTLPRSQAAKAYRCIWLGRIQYGITTSTMW
jgi:hypothetical protein